jgi:hypothetical protein
VKTYLKRSQRLAQYVVSVTRVRKEMEAVTNKTTDDAVAQLTPAMPWFLCGKPNSSQAQYRLGVPRMARKQAAGISNRKAP